jgi:hypothetical protein
MANNPLRMPRGSTDSNVDYESYPAAVDLSASMDCFVRVDDDGYVVLCGDGELPLGVLTNAPEAPGRVAAVMTQPGRKVTVKTGGAFAIGDSLVCDGSGRAVGGIATSDNKVGTALIASGGADEHVEMLFAPSGNSF